MPKKFSSTLIHTEETEYTASEDHELGVDVKCCGPPYWSMIAKACFAMLILVSISLITSPVMVTWLLRYVNSLTSSVDLLLISTGLLLVVFTRTTNVFFDVDLQSNFVALRSSVFC